MAPKTKRGAGGLLLQVRDIGSVPCRCEFIRTRPNECGPAARIRRRDLNVYLFHSHQFVRLKCPKGTDFESVPCDSQRGPPGEEWGLGKAAGDRDHEAGAGVLTAEQALSFAVGVVVSGIQGEATDVHEGTGIPVPVAVGSIRPKHLLVEGVVTSAHEQAGAGQGAGAGIEGATQGGVEIGARVTGVEGSSE